MQPDPSVRRRSLPERSYTAHRHDGMVGKYDYFSTHLHPGPLNTELIVFNLGFLNVILRLSSFPPHFNSDNMGSQFLFWLSFLPLFSSTLLFLE